MHLHATARTANLRQEHPRSVRGVVLSSHHSMMRAVMTPPEDKIIEIKGRTVLKLGGYLITIEPEVVEEKKFRTVTPADAGGRSDIAKQLAAEADLVQKTRIPFDGSQIRRPPRIGTAPVPGDKFTVGTTERVISRIASHHGGLWA